MTTIYLLHFKKRYPKGKRPQHYIGSTDDLDSRIERHRAGNGSRLIEVITKAGIDFVVARTWQGGKIEERRIKRRREARKLCPICSGDRALKICIQPIPKPRRHV